jgi:hypothetical protein
MPPPFHADTPRLVQPPGHPSIIVAAALRFARGSATFWSRLMIGSVHLETV